MILFGNKIWAFSQIAPLPFEKSLRKTPEIMDKSRIREVFYGI